MSVNYYLRNTARYKDCENLSSYWNDGFKDYVYNLIYKYAKQHSVSEETSDEIIDEIKERLTCFPISEDYYDQKIGYSSTGKFYFSNNYYSSIAIHSIDELKEFLETHTEYELVDEYGEPCDIKELLKMNKA